MSRRRLVPRLTGRAPRRRLRLRSLPDRVAPGAQWGRAGLAWLVLLLLLTSLGAAAWAQAPGSSKSAPSAAPASAAAGSAGSTSAASEAPRPALKPRAHSPRVPAPLPVLGEADGAGQVLVVIPIHGTIDRGLSPFVKRSIALAEQRKARAIILDVDTFGGRVDAATVIRDALLKTSVPVVAYVNRRAISAGALISYAADHIVFTSGASMGAATPIQMQGGQAQAVGEKMVSYMRSEMRATAEANGRNGDVAEAMVDREIEVEGVSEAGKLLTLATDKALEIGLATAKHESLGELIGALGLQKATQVTPQTNWAERVARFLTDPVVSGLLMSLGMLGLLIELYSPGFGFAGGLGLLCLMMFFGGHMVVDLAGWEEVIIFAFGVVLLGVEIFIIPGFGVVGALGIAAIVASLVMSLLGTSVGEAWSMGVFGNALGTVLLSVAGAVVAMFVIAKFLPKSRFGRFLVLETALASSGSTSEDGTPDFLANPAGWRAYNGKRGIAQTDLRLAGKAMIEGQLVDVVSQHEYIKKGAPIRVIAVEGVRIVVIRDAAEAEPAG